MERFDQIHALGQLPEQVFVGIAGRQMQDDTVIVLFDLSRDLEQLQNNGIGLCGDKFSVLECLGAQLLMQHVGGAMQYRPQAVGEDASATKLAQSC